MQLLHQFLEKIAAEGRVTRSTLSAYEADLQDFYKFIKRQPVENVTLQDVQAYLLTQKHLSSSTVARRLSSLRQFYTFLIRKGDVQENPFMSIKVTSYKSKHSSVVTQEDRDRLLKGAEEWGGAEGKRLAVLLQFFFISDLAVNELVSLPVTVGLKALKSEKSCLTVTKKENKTLSLPLTAPALESLRAYLMVRSRFLVNNKESDWLFPSLSQKGHLTRQRFGQLVKELSLKVGLDSERLSLSKIRRGIHV